MARKRLGELLLERGVITAEQLEQGLRYQRQSGHRLGASLVALGHVSEDKLCEVLAVALGLKHVHMPPDQIDWTALHTLRSRFCEANDLFPLRMESSGQRRTLVIAMADPLNIPAIEEIEFTTGIKVVPVIAPLTGIRDAIRRHYLKQNPAEDGKLTIVQAGGKELSSVPDVPAEPEHVTEETARPEDELPTLDTGDVAEITERSALADIIGQKIQKRRLKREPGAARPAGTMEGDLAFLFGVNPDSPSEQVEKLESRFWALLRLMAKKGLITRDEFLKELGGDEED